MPLTLTVSCFSKIQIGFTFLVPAHLVSRGQRAVKRVCVCFHRRPLQPVSKPPSDWKWSPGRPNHTWLRAVESDLRPLKIGPSYAWKKAASREHWSGVWTQWHPRRVCREETERVNCNLIDRETAVLAWSLLTGHLFTVQRDDWCMVCMQDSVYVKFVSEAAAGQGFRALHGWMYDGRNSTVSFPSRDHVLMILFFAPSFYAAQVVPDNTHTLCMGLPGWAGTRKLKPVWILRVWQWHQLGHMQVCTSLQTGNHSSTSPAQYFTGRMPCLPPNQQCQSTEGRQRTVKWLHADACVWGTLHVSDQMINRLVKCLELKHLTVQVTIWSDVYNAPLMS